jgi:Mg2+ and Co2+ transporter CorA
VPRQVLEERQFVGAFFGIPKAALDGIARISQSNKVDSFDDPSFLELSTFLRAHWKVLFAADFLTTEVWTARGLVTHYLLFLMSLSDRVVAIAGITTRPD